MNAKHICILLLLISGFGAQLRAQEPPVRLALDSIIPIMPYHPDATSSKELQIKQIDVDGLGNQYILLTLFFGISTQVDLDPGPGEVWLDDPASNEWYLVKYDPDGNFQWVKRWNHFGNVVNLFFKVDTVGNVYIHLQYYDDDVDLDPGPGVVPMNPDSGNHFVKLDTEGDYQWHFSYGPEELVRCDLRPFLFGVDLSDVSDAGDFLLFGEYAGTMDIDPDPNREVWITAPPCTDDPADPRGYFLCSFDTNGDLIWYRTVMGDIGIRYIAQYDGQGNLILNGNWDMPGVPVTEVEWHNTITKISPAGSTIWTFNPFPLGGMDNPSSLSDWRAAALDADDNLIVSTSPTTDELLGALPSMDLDPGPKTAFVRDDGYMNGITAKYNRNRTLQWAIPRGHHELLVDSENSFYGENDRDVEDADPGPGHYSTVQAKFGSLDHVKYNSKGEFLWTNFLTQWKPNKRTPLPTLYRQSGMGPNQHFGALWVDLDWEDGEYWYRRTSYWNRNAKQWIPHYLAAFYGRRPVLMPEVYVDRDFLGAQHGTATNPYNNMSAALSMLEPGGKIVMHASESSETPTLDTPMTITSFGGPSRIGVLPPPVAKSTDEPNRAEMGFVTRSNSN